MGLYSTEPSVMWRAQCPSVSVSGLSVKHYDWRWFWFGQNWLVGDCGFTWMQRAPPRRHNFSVAFSSQDLRVFTLKRFCKLHSIHNFALRELLFIACRILSGMFTLLSVIQTFISRRSSSFLGSVELPNIALIPGRRSTLNFHFE